MSKHNVNPQDYGWQYTGQNTNSRVEFYQRDGAKMDYYPTTGEAPSPQVSMIPRMGCWDARKERRTRGANSNVGSDHVLPQSPQARLNCAPPLSAGTVKTSMEHPTQGKTQMFRRDLNVRHSRGTARTPVSKRPRNTACTAFLHSWCSASNFHVTRRHCTVLEKSLKSTTARLASASCPPHRESVSTWPVPLQDADFARVCENPRSHTGAGRLRQLAPHARPHPTHRGSPHPPGTDAIHTPLAMPTPSILEHPNTHTHRHVRVSASSYRHVQYSVEAKDTIRDLRICHTHATPHPSICMSLHTCTHTPPPPPPPRGAHLYVHSSSIVRCGVWGMGVCGVYT